MTTEIDSNTSTYGEIWEFTQKLAAQGAPNWQGRIVTWEDALLCSQDIQESVFNVLDAWEDVDDPSFDRLAAQFIWAGTLPESRHLLDREIQYLVTGKDEVFVQQVGFNKKASKFWKKPAESTAIHRL